MNWPVFFKRLLGAIIYVAVMFAGLLWAHPMAILVLAALLQFLAIRELFNIAKKMYPKQAFPLYHFLIAIVNSVYLIVVLIDKSAFALLPLILVPVILFFTIALNKRIPIASGLTALLSILYIGIPIAILVDLKSIDIILPIGILCLIWINDTMAYITGSFIGKTPFSDISPKKTIEGTVGGIVFTMVIGWVYGTYLQRTYEPIHWIMIALLVATFGTLGDLLESQIKRKAGIKDSGNILPGHGGALDRLDSILAVLPIVYVYVYLFMNLQAPINI